MAQQTSELWKRLVRDPDTRREYRVKINDVEYGEDALIAHSVSGGLFETAGIGHAAAAVLNLTLVAPDVPRGAKIERDVRLVLGDEESEWLPKGRFWTNRRSESDGIWDIEAFDALRRGAVPYAQEGEQDEWPKKATDVVAEIAAMLGVELDPRTPLDDSIMVGHPGDRTVQTVLCHIGAALGGNWYITDAGLLRLVRLNSAPAETSLLVDEYGDYITLGGVRIRV